MAKKDTSIKPDDFQQLRHQAAEGNLQALGELLNSFRELLLRYSHQHIPKDLEAKIDEWDVVQETFIKASQNFHLFKGRTKKELAAWLRVIMRHVIDNLLRDYRRSKRDIRREIPLSSHGEIVIASADPSLAEEEMPEEVKKFPKIFPRLPELYRQVLYLREQEGLPYKEIAVRLGGTAEGVRKLHERAIKRFVEEWKKL
jgi:RNA polymerase sigma-70 factor (ECF subfamily)